MNASGRALGAVVVMLGTAYAGGGILAESAALGGAKILANREGKVFKVAKVTFMLIALIAAAVVTGGLSVSALVEIGLYFDITVNPILMALGIIALTAPLHMKAFQWSQLT